VGSINQSKKRSWFLLFYKSWAYSLSPWCPHWTYSWSPWRMRKTISSKWDQSRAPKHMHFLCMRVSSPIWNPNINERKRRIHIQEREATSNLPMNFPSLNKEMERKGNQSVVIAIMVTILNSLAWRKLLNSCHKHSSRTILGITILKMARS